MSEMNDVSGFACIILTFANIMIQKARCNGISARTNYLRVFVYFGEVGRVLFDLFDTSAIVGGGESLRIQVNSYCPPSLQIRGHSSFRDSHTHTTPIDWRDFWGFQVNFYICLKKLNLIYTFNFQYPLNMGARRVRREPESEPGEHNFKCLHLQ